MKKHNFNAGPSILPEFTIKNTAENILNLNGSGLSLMEISHRSKEYTAINDEAIALMKEVMDIPSGYSVLFLQGGASLQFCMVPFNLLNKKAAFLETGVWAKKAIKEAKFFGQADIIASSADKNFNYIPKNFTIPADADYFHITSNNTIYGTELKKDIDSPVPLVVDASSDILSRQIDVSKYAIIYGGVQKNLGPSGVAVVIIKDDVLGKVERKIPTMLDFKTHMEEKSLFNTPATVTVFACVQTLKWLKNLGGLKGMQKLNIEKAKILYDEIDRNKLFVCTVPNEEDRSLMNVTFVMDEKYKELENSFQEFASSKGMVGIKGHRSVGGFRASIYNAMPKSSIQALVDCMKEFEAKN